MTSFGQIIGYLLGLGIVYVIVGVLTPLMCIGAAVSVMAVSGLLYKE